MHRDYLIQQSCHLAVFYLLIVQAREALPEEMARSCSDEGERDQIHLAYQQGKRDAVQELEVYG
jgi:hypothetical protein